MQIRPHNLAVYPSRRLQEMVMIVPIDTQINETQNIAQKYRQQRFEGHQIRTVRNLQFQHHNRNNDGKHTVAESFEPRFVHIPSQANRSSGRFQKLPSLQGRQRKDIFLSYIFLWQTQNKKIKDRRIGADALSLSMAHDKCPMAQVPNVDRRHLPTAKAAGLSLY
jgi:hypothetical protein